MSDIMPGDLVKCVKTDKWVRTLTGDICEGPIYGQILMVSNVSASSFFKECLEFLEFPLCIYNSERFIKINPDSEKKATKVWDWNKEPINV